MKRPRVRQSFPRRADVGSRKLEAPREIRCVAGRARAQRRERRELGVERRPCRGEVADLDLGRRQVPRDVRVEPPADAPVRCARLEQPDDRVRPPLRAERVRERVDRKRVARLDLERAARERRGARRVARLVAAERRHREHDVVARVARRPGLERTLGDRVHLRAPGEEEPARLREPQREQVERVVRADRGVEMRREQRPVREPRVRGRNVLSFALARELDVRLRCSERALEPRRTRGRPSRPRALAIFSRCAATRSGRSVEQRVERRGRVRRGAAQERVAQLVGRARRRQVADFRVERSRGAVFAAGARPNMTGTPRLLTETPDCAATSDVGRRTLLESLKRQIFSRPPAGAGRARWL